MDSKSPRPYKFAAKYSIAVATLAFTAAVVLFVDISLLTMSISSFVRKIFVYRNFMKVKIDPTFFCIPAGFLCFPVTFLTILMKSNKLTYMIMLVGLQVIATIILSTGHLMGTTYVLDYSNETVHLHAMTIPREALVKTLQNLIANYETFGNSTALDRIQNRLSCCGIDSQLDFKIIPDSCCSKGDCENFDVWPSGCLRIIQEDVAWQKNVTLSLTELFILMYFFSLTMALTVFVSDYNKRKSIRRANDRQSR